MNESLDDKKKKIAFLDGIIREKSDSVSALEREAAAIRKKNGAFASADLDISLYRANMKISAEKKAISDCKREKKRLKEECAELLLKDYADHLAYKDRVKIRAALSELYDGKASIIDETQTEEFLAVSAVKTADKRLDGKIFRLVAAGVVTSVGKVVKLPKIEVYEYFENANEGETYTFAAPKAVTITKRKKAGDGYRLNFKFLRDNAPICGFLALVACFAVSANLTKVALSASAQDGVYALSLLTAISLAAYFLLSLNSATFKKSAVTALISGGIILVASFINFDARKLIFPLTVVVVSGVFAFSESKTASIKSADEVFLPLGIIFGGGIGNVFGVIYDLSGVAERIWLISAIAIIGVAGAFSAAFSMLKRREQIGASDFFEAFSAAVFIGLGFKIGFNFIGISACVLGLVFAAAEIIRLLTKNS